MPPDDLCAIGRLAPDGPWIGFGYRGGSCRLVLGSAGGLQEAPADGGLLLALAIAHYAVALNEPPPDLEATPSDMSRLVRYLLEQEADAARHAHLAEALDAIDDGLAGDAVAARLAAARAPDDAPVDPVELLLDRTRELSAG